jgi:lysophospholipase L1-like esterase
VIASLDALTFAAPKEKGKAELVEGKVGKAVRFAFEKDGRGAFFTSAIRGTPAWDRAAGFSFWVKGNGTDQFAGLELIYDNDYAVRYDYCFPVRGTDWRKVTVAWADLMPVLPGPKAKPLGPGGNPPSKVSGLWVGKWWYWGDYPAGTFALDELRLEPTIDRAAADSRPAGPPLGRVREKLKAGKPLTVVTMGDSLTDTRHWANRKVVWPALLADAVKAKYKSEVTVHNPAIGGTQLRQNLVLIPRWADQVPEPDLVTVFFGGNDWEAGMRGKEFTAACADAVDRIRRVTRGKADVLLLTTNPTVARWETTAELAAACRAAAKAKNAGLADTEKAFHTAGKDDRNRLYVDDRVHLSPAGHAVIAETVLKAIESGGN